MPLFGVRVLRLYVFCPASRIGPVEFSFLTSPCRYIGTPEQFSFEHSFDHCGVMSKASFPVGLPIVIVSVDVPPLLMVEGTNVIPSVGNAFGTALGNDGAASAPTVSCALTDGTLPWSVCSMLVVLVTVPGV